MFYYTWADEWLWPPISSIHWTKQRMYALLQ